MSQPFRQLSAIRTIKRVLRVPSDRTARGVAYELALLTPHGGAGEVAVTLEELSREAMLEEHAVRRALKRLVEVGLLYPPQRRGSVATVYRWTTLAHSPGKSRR